MTFISKKSITEVCENIDQIIENDDYIISAKEYKYLSLHLGSALKRINYIEIEIICETVLKIAVTKNRTLRIIERDFWNFISRIPNHIFLSYGFEDEKYDTIEPNFDYENSDLKKLSKLLGLAIEILKLTDDKSKGSELRRTESLNLISSLLNYFKISLAKELFINSIRSNSLKEQIAAFEGLKYYFSSIDEEVDNELNIILDDIIENTTNRTIALSCLQILISSGKLDENSAITRIEKMKEKKWKI